MATSVSFALKDNRPCRLRLGRIGPHRFGSQPGYRGITPPGADTPLHLLVRLDLADADCPIKSDGSTRYLPLFYPLKYGCGGPEVQYAVLSDKEVRILHLSDEAPDAEDHQYVRVAQLPSSRAEILPLRYEEARILAFSEADAYFQPDAADQVILDNLDRGHPLILIGGHRRLPVNAGDVVCRNSDCEFYSRRVRVDIIASIPPVPVDGADDFWHEYQGGNVDFYFCLCRYCRTIIAFNVAG
jgi:hypothetical protein